MALPPQKKRMAFEDLDESYTQEMPMALLTAPSEREDAWRDTRQVTPKIPPGYTGRTSWFAHEDAIDDWLDITTLEPEKQGPSLKKQITRRCSAIQAIVGQRKA